MLLPIFISMLVKNYNFFINCRSWQASDSKQYKRDNTQNLHKCSSVHVRRTQQGLIGLIFLIVYFLNSTSTFHIQFVCQNVNNLVNRNLFYKRNDSQFANILQGNTNFMETCPPLLLTSSRVIQQIGHS